LDNNKTIPGRVGSAAQTDSKNVVPTHQSHLLEQNKVDIPPITASSDRGDAAIHSEWSILRSINPSVILARKLERERLQPPVNTSNSNIHPIIVDHHSLAEPADDKNLSHNLDTKLSSLSVSRFTRGGPSNVPLVGSPMRSIPPPNSNSIILNTTNTNQRERFTQINQTVAGAQRRTVTPAVAAIPRLGRNAIGTIQLTPAPPLQEIPPPNTPTTVSLVSSTAPTSTNTPPTQKVARSKRTTAQRSQEKR